MVGMSVLSQVDVLDAYCMAACTGPAPSDSIVTSSCSRRLATVLEGVDQYEVQGAGQGFYPTSSTTDLVLSFLEDHLT